MGETCCLLQSLPQRLITITALVPEVLLGGYRAEGDSFACESMPKECGPCSLRWLCPLLGVVCEVPRSAMGLASPGWITRCFP